MNKNLVIALMSASLMLASSADVLAQRGAMQGSSSNNGGTRAADTRGQHSNSSSATPAASQSSSSRSNNTAASSHLDGNRNAAPANNNSVAPSNNNRSNQSVAPAKNNGKSNDPTLRQKGREVQTATKNKNLPAEKIAPSENYRKMAPRGGEVSKHKATGSAQIIRHNNQDFYYKKGVFYKHENNKYVVSRAPIGARVHDIPTPRIILLHNIRYYYYYGVYYTLTSTNEYEVVQAPVGALVESIPDGYEKLTIDGETYYIVDGVQYKAVIYDGEIWYEVIKVND